MTLDEIAEALRKYRIEVVAAETGLHFNTVRRYREGQVTNPPALTKDILTAYLSARLDREGGA